MNPHLPGSGLRGLGCFLVVLSFLALFAAECLSAGRKSKVVWVVFFASRDCPHCESARDLLRALQKKYPIRIKQFDIDRSDDYALFHKLGEIHSEKGFGVPLILVGDSIIQGEAKIIQDLEETIRKFAKAGGAPLPYLGEKAGKPSKKKKPEARCIDCDRRPPTLGEEWKKVRDFVGSFF
ncbi:MAG: thioredoxin family protein [Thermodesulfobacteriota bacterium]